MNPQTYILVAEKLVEAVLQMEQIVDRLINAHDENIHWLEQKDYENNPF